MIHNEIDKSHIENRRFRAYMLAMPPHYIGGFLTAFPFIYFIFGQGLNQNGAQALIWFLLGICLALSSASLYIAYYKKRSLFKRRARHWVSAIPLSIYIIGFAVAPWLFLDGREDIQIYTMLVCIASLSGTTAYALSYYIKRQLLFLWIPLVSLSLKVYSLQAEEFVVMLTIIMFVGVSASIFSVTVAKSLSQAIVQNIRLGKAYEEADKANKQKSQFLSAASHDIRQPLQAIYLFIDTLKSHQMNNDSKKVIGYLEESVDGMSELLNSLLDVSKLDANTVKPYPGHHPVEPMLQKLSNQFAPQARSKGLDFTLHQQTHVVFADPILLDQVLSNLLSNAIRYTKTGSINMYTEAKSDSLRITVKDTGIGIHPIEQSKIFNEFYQIDNPERDKQKGLGLGLAIVKRLCELQGWAIELISMQNQGSQFSVTIPLGEQNKVEVNTLNSAVSFNNLPVMIIDNDTEVLTALELSLKAFDCEVLAFSALGDAKAYLTSEGAIIPQIIISDYRLGDDVDGIQAIQELNDMLDNRVPSLLISGDTSITQLQTIQDSGLLVLHKPITPAKLRLSMHAAISQN